MALQRQTILVAGGLARRAGHEDLEHLVLPELARRFSGLVEIHDAERPDLASSLLDSDDPPGGDKIFGARTLADQISIDDRHRRIALIRALRSI